MRLLRGDGPLLRVGHRGAAALAPENTLRAFEAALARGVDAIEFDVLDLPRGPLVLAHSTTCTRSATARRRARARRSLDELREVAPELPTLDEALDFLAARDVALHVDLKLTTRLDELVDGARAARARRARGRELVPRAEPAEAVAASRQRIAIGFTYPEDRYGVSRRRALQPAMRLGTLALRRALVRARPGDDRARRRTGADAAPRGRLAGGGGARARRAARPSGPGRSTTRPSSRGSTPPASTP